jgi:hypothetical protein
MEVQAIEQGSPDPGLERGEIQICRDRSPELPVDHSDLGRRLTEDDLLEPGVSPRLVPIVRGPADSSISCLSLLREALESLPQDPDIRLPEGGLQGEIGLRTREGRSQILHCGRGDIDRERRHLYASPELSRSWIFEEA